jgi:hypothetical protein
MSHILVLEEYWRNHETRIRELEAAVAERDEAIRVLAVITTQSFGRARSICPCETCAKARAQKADVLSNPIARAAVEAAKGGTK